MGYAITIDIDYTLNQRDIQKVLTSIKRKFKEPEIRALLNGMKDGDEKEIQYEDALICVEKFDV